MNLFSKEQTSEKKTYSLSDWLLSLSALAFLLLYLLLSFYNRPYFDDFLCIELIKKNSLLEFSSHWYTHLSGRWTAMGYIYLTTMCNADFLSAHYYYFIYYCLSFFILVYSINAIIRFGLNKISTAPVDLMTTLTYSVLFIACFYFSTFQNIEVWWWISASYFYIQGIVFLLFGLSLMLKEKKNWLHYLLICLSFIYVGGSFEIYSLIIGSLFILTLFYVSLLKPNGFARFKNSCFFKGFVIAFVSLSISTFVSIAAPGNQVRRDFVTQTESLSDGHSNKAFVSPLSLHIFAQTKYGIALVLSGLWMLLGMKLNFKNSNAIENKKLTKILLLASLPVFVSLLITYSFQVFVLDHSPIPLRSWTFSSFALAAFFCFLFFVIGFHFRFSNLIQGVLKISIPSVTILLLSFTVYKQYNYTSNYSKKYDELMFALIEATKTPETKIVRVKKLPESGMLMQLYIGDRYTDEQLTELLGVKYEIIAED